VKRKKVNSQKRGFRRIPFSFYEKNEKIIVDYKFYFLDKLDRDNS